MLQPTAAEDSSASAIATSRGGSDPIRRCSFFQRSEATEACAETSDSWNARAPDSESALSCSGISISSYRAELGQADCRGKQAAAACGPTFLLSATPCKPLPAITQTSPGHDHLVSVFSPDSSSEGNSPSPGQNHFVSVFSPDSSLEGDSPTTGRRGGQTRRPSPSDYNSGSPSGYLAPVAPFSPFTPSFLFKSGSPPVPRSRSPYLSPSDPTLHP